MGLLLMIAFIALISYVAGMQVAQANQPDCPTEDSCSVDYSHGRWTIREEIP